MSVRVVKLHEVHKDAGSAEKGNEQASTEASSNAAGTNLERKSGEKAFTEAAGLGDDIDLTTRSGKEAMLDSVNERTAANREGDDLILKDWGPAFDDLSAVSMQEVFEELQGRTCLDLCVWCGPDKDNNLKSLLATRKKGRLSKFKAVLTIPTNITFGAVKGSAAGVRPGLENVVKKGLKPARWMNEKVEKSTWLVRLVAASLGLSIGLASVPVFGVLGMMEHASKGIALQSDLTRRFTKCNRVGFEIFENGGDAAKGKQYALPQSVGNQSGMSKLRDNTDEASADSEAINHCKHVKRNMFDIRHAQKCVKHSKLCGVKGGMVIPGLDHDRCKEMSDWDGLDLSALEGAVGKENVQKMERRMPALQGQRARYLANYCDHIKNTVTSWSQPDEGLGADDDVDKKAMLALEQRIDAGDKKTIEEAMNNFCRPLWNAIRDVERKRQAMLDALQDMMRGTSSQEQKQFEKVEEEKMDLDAGAFEQMHEELRRILDPLWMKYSDRVKKAEEEAMEETHEDEEDKEEEDDEEEKEEDSE